MPAQRRRSRCSRDCEFGPDHQEHERIWFHVSPGLGFLGGRGVSRGWTGAVEPRAFAAALASARYWPSVMVRRLLPSVSEIVQVQGRPMAGLLIYLILGDYRIPTRCRRSSFGSGEVARRNGKAAANRAPAVVPSVWNWAARRDEVRAGANPCLGIERLSGECASVF
jgi:hypothetical protein